LGRRPLGAIIHSSNEPDELSQWLWHDNSTINIVLVIIIIIIIIGSRTWAFQGTHYWTHKIQDGGDPPSLNREIAISQ